MAGSGGFPIADRAMGEVLFRLPAQAGHGTSITASKFLAAAARLAAELPDASFLINLCQNRLHFSVSFAAAMLAGKVTLLTSDRSVSRLRQLAMQYPGACTISEDSQPLGLPHGCVRLSLLEDAAEGAALTFPILAADQLVATVFTSGSTGEPIGHEKTWGALVQRSRAAALRFGLEPEVPPSLVGTVPGQHMYGFETTVLLPLHAPASSWCGPAFYPADVQAALSAVPEPRILITTPLQLRALLQTMDEPPTIARVISATAPLPPDLAGLAEQRWGSAVWEIFGATEVGSIASRRTTHDPLWTLYPGVTLDANEERVLVTAEGARPCPLNDVIEPVPEGRFRLLGRPADMIKLGGRRASLAGLNRILSRIEGVLDGAFVAPEDYEQQPTARMLTFVVAPYRTADDILNELREHIDPVFLPRRVIKVPSLPRNEIGKLSQKALIALRAHAGEE
ncbi:MAG: acyl-CoA synthetase [Acetobacteraceae bacterium]|nr:acyl-CoA synthetase [Acetobacteraceae bacterium]